jgi:hypothetical protein
MSTEILQFVRQYSVYSGCIIFTSGVIGNILNILTFTQLKLFRDNRWAFYLTVESISSFLYQFVYITVTILTAIYGDDATGRFLPWCRLRYTVPVALVLTTFYTVCLAAIDQFFSTNRRFNLQQLCTLRQAQRLTFVCVCFWIAHSIVFGCFFNIRPSFGCVISNSIMLRYTTYFYYPVLSGALPITVASFFAFLAYRNVRRIVRRQIPIVRRRLDQQMTAMILMRVILLVCLVSPFTIFRIFIINFPISQSELTKYAIAQLVQTILISFVSLNYAVTLSFLFESHL